MGIERPTPQSSMPGMAAKGLQQRGLTPQAIVGASMRKSVHPIYGVLKSGEPFKAEIPMAGLETQEGI